MRSRSSLTDYGRTDASKRAKIQPVERAATKISTLEASSRWRPTGNLPSKYTRPEKYPVLKDPKLVRAGQLAFFDLLTTLPPQNKTEYVVKMYSLIECKLNCNLKLFNTLPLDRALMKSERILREFDSQKTS